MKVKLISGRTIDQGTSKELGKTSEEYSRSIAICEMNSETLAALKINEGDHVKIKTEDGYVVLSAKKTRRTLSQGSVFVPYGAWVNVVIPSFTDSTGMPQFKGIDANIESTTENILDLTKLINHKYGKPVSKQLDK